MMNQRTKVGVMAIMALFVVALVAVPALAADEGGGGPWDDVVVTFGAVALAWTSVQMGVIRVLRGVSIGGKPLLATDGAVWLANGIIGVVGLVIAATQSGEPLLASVMQALLAFFAASGQHELLSKTGKSPSLPDSPEPQSGQG